MTADNMQQVRQLVDLTDTDSGAALWAPWSLAGTFVTLLPGAPNRSGTLLIAPTEPLSLEFPPPVSVFSVNAETLLDLVLVSPDGSLSVSYIVSEVVNRKLVLQITDANTGLEVAQVVADSPLIAHGYSLNVVMPQFAEAGHLLYTRDGTLYQWSLESSAEALLIYNHSESEFNFTDLRINETGTYALARDIFGTVNLQGDTMIFDLRMQPARPIYHEVFLPVDRWHSIAISPDSRTIAAGGNNANVRIWDVSDPRLWYSENNPPSEFGEQPIVEMVYSPDGRYIAGCSSYFAFVQEARTGERLVTISGHFAPSCSVAFDPSGERIAFGTGNGSIHIWDVNRLLTQETIYAEDADIGLGENIDGDFAAPTYPVVDVNFSSDGMMLASASWDGTAKIWDIETQSLLALYGGADRLWSAIFSPDDQWLATSGQDGGVNLWSVGGDHGYTLMTHTVPGEYTESGMVSLAFNHDGTLLAATDHHGRIFLIDTYSGESRQLEGAYNVFWHVRFNATGTLLAAASWDTRVFLWGIDS
jgi:WD40 repeat protein